MQPETDYEIEGYYRGVCFPCGKVVIGDTLFVYYGGGDNNNNNDQDLSAAQSQMRSNA